MQGKGPKRLPNSLKALAVRYGPRKGYADYLKGVVGGIMRNPKGPRTQIIRF